MIFKLLCLSVSRRQQKCEYRIGFATFDVNLALFMILSSLIETVSFKIDVAHLLMLLLLKSD